jgi:hypothetical protein
MFKVTAAMVCSCLCATLSSGQQASVGVFPISLNEASPKEHVVGSELSLALKRSNLPATFHARFFIGLKSEIIADARARRDEARRRGERDDCVGFTSAVLTATARGNTVRFYSSPDEGWLTTAGEARVYTVVFEAGDEPADSYVRLHFDELEKTYFADAIQVIVKPGDRAPNPSVIKVIQENARQRAEQQQQQAVQRPTLSRCWFARSVTSSLHRNNEPLQITWMVRDSCIDSEVPAVGQ